MLFAVSSLLLAFWQFAIGSLLFAICYWRIAYCRYIYPIAKGQSPTAKGQSPTAKSQSSNPTFPPTLLTTYYFHTYHLPLKNYHLPKPILIIRICFHCFKTCGVVFNEPDEEGCWINFIGQQLIPFVLYLLFVTGVC